MSGKCVRSDVFRVRRGRPAWAVPILLFLAVVVVAALAFNLANLDTGGEALPGTPNAGGTPPSAVGDLGPDPIVEVGLIMLFGFLVVGTVVLAVRRRVYSRLNPKPRSWWEVLSSVMGLFLVIAFLVAWPHVLDALRSTASASTPAASSSGANPTWPAAAGAPAGLFLVGTVFIAILLLAFLLRRGAGAFASDSDADEMPANRWAATEVVQAAIEELELGGDVRAVVLACFQRFCGLLGTRGITAQVALTPRELERLAVDRLAVSPDASETLTSLFEEARYSEHPLAEDARSRAIDSLARIRSALEA